MIYVDSTDGTSVTVCDHLGERTMSKVEFKELLNTRPSTSEYVFIPFSKVPIKEKGKPPRIPTINEQFDQVIVDADLLKAETNGKINLYKTGTDSRTAKYAFEEMTKFINPDPLSNDEAEWLRNATKGALIWGEQYTGEDAHKYDVCSMYPSSMQHKLMFFPMKRGQFKNITETEFNTEQKQVPYGIYRCVIEENEQFQKLFRWNKTNYYTHIDVQWARQINLKVTLVQDRTANSLFYDRDSLTTGNILFGEYVELFYNIKKKGIAKAKSLLNILWGALSQKNILKMYVKDNEIFDIKEDKIILTMKPINDKEIYVEFYKHNELYETDYARIKPFLLARGRSHIGRIMKPYANELVRVNTDGFISKTKLNIKTGNDIGELKYEGYYKTVNVIHCNKVEGKFVEV